MAKANLRSRCFCYCLYELPTWDSSRVRCEIRDMRGEYIVSSFCSLLVTFFHFVLLRQLYFAWDVLTFTCIFVFVHFFCILIPVLRWDFSIITSHFLCCHVLYFALKRRCGCRHRSPCGVIWRHMVSWVGLGRHVIIFFSYTLFLMGVIVGTSLSP